MKIFVAQFYLEAGANYPFSHHFQIYLSNELTRLTIPYEKFITNYAEDFNLIFRISAKSEITESDIKGPAVYKRDKDVEFTIFLPFDKQASQSKRLYRQVLKELICQIVNVLESLEIDVTQILQNSDEIIETIVTTPKMIKRDLRN